MAYGTSDECTGHRRDQRNSLLTCIKVCGKAFVSQTHICPSGNAVVSRSKLEESTPLKMSLSAK